MRLSYREKNYSYGILLNKNDHKLTAFEWFLASLFQLSAAYFQQLPIEPEASSTPIKVVGADFPVLTEGILNTFIYLAVSSIWD